MYPDEMDLAKTSNIQQNLNVTLQPNQRTYNLKTVLRIWTPLMTRSSVQPVSAMIITVLLQFQMKETSPFFLLVIALYCT